MGTHRRHWALIGGTDGHSWAALMDTYGWHRWALIGGHWAWMGTVGWHWWTLWGGTDGHWGGSTDLPRWKKWVGSDESRL